MRGHSVRWVLTFLMTLAVFLATCIAMASDHCPLADEKPVLLDVPDQYRNSGMLIQSEAVHAGPAETFNQGFTQGRAVDPRASVSAAVSVPEVPTQTVAQPIDHVLVSNVPELAQPLRDPVELPKPDPLAKRIPILMKRPHTEAHSQLAERLRLLKLSSAAALVVDQQEGRLLFAKNPEAVRSIASITKLMTAMVILDSGLSLEEFLTIETEDVNTIKRTRSRLTPGVSLTRRDTLKLALMSSENRAAAALARTYPGGSKAFVQAMNQKARDLDMRQTLFLDSTGLNPRNVSTAHDLALMVNAGYEYPLIREFTTSAAHYLPRTDRHDRMPAFHNSNGLVRSGRWDIGLSKTGYINEAGRCLVMQATIAAKPVIIVLLDSRAKATRAADAYRIKRSLEGLDVDKPVKIRRKRHM